jgi:hypothetical protein
LQKSYGINTHELKIVSYLDLKGTVTTSSSFNGNSWLIEVNYKASSVFIKHHSKLTENTTVFFKITN